MRRFSFFLAILFAATALFAADETCPTTWDYQHPWTGQCATGTKQSPIANIASQRTANPALQFPQINYPDSAPVTVKNTSKEIKVYPMFNGMVTVNGKTARLVQFHFHVPKEHRLDVWNDAEAELHLVHQTEDGSVIVIAVAIVKSTTSNPALAALRNFGTVASCTSKASLRPNQFIPMNALLPEVRGRYITYVGSLTTPPCDPNVTFILMNDGIRATEEEIRYLRLGNGNARDVQSNSNPVTFRVAMPGDGQ